MALALGRTVRELLATVDSAEVTEWIAYSELEPWGIHADDVRAAIIASTTANVWARRPHKLADFIPRWDGGERQPQDIKAVQAAWKAAATRNNGRQHKHGKPTVDGGQQAMGSGAKAVRKQPRQVGDTGQGDGRQGR